MNDVRFGFLMEQTAIDWDAGRIRPLDNHAAVVETITENERAYGGWFYPPLQPVKQLARESKPAPQVPTGFSLEPTHMLTLDGDTWTDECANFFIALFGMLKGLRLQREGWQHFYKVPIESKLCDFSAKDSEIALAMNKATTFWLHAHPIARKLAYGALHWHLFAQLYEHEFELFNAQYMALDACSELAMEIPWPHYASPTSGRPPHASRAEELCRHVLTVPPIPVWAKVKSKNSAVAMRRNNLIHEAMYGGQPIGFSHPIAHPDMLRELTGLVARILLRLLGIDNGYTQSDCTIRSTHEFRFNA